MTYNTQNLTPGRKEKNKPKKIWEYVGEDNFNSLIELQLKTALGSPNESLMYGAQQYLIDKIIPKASPSTIIKIEFKKMDCIEDIKQNELLILEKVGDGSISLEEGDRLFSMTEKVRKTFEVAEIAEKVALMDARMVSKGI